MVAVSPPRFRSSIVETLIARAATARKQRAARARPSVVALLFLAVLDSAGTLLAAGALVLGGFLAVTWLGWMLLAPAILLLDFELTSAVRRRAGR